VNNKIESLVFQSEPINEGQCLSVVVRVIEGELRLGDTLNCIRGPDGTRRQVELTVQRILLLAHDVDLLIPVNSGKIEISGNPGGELNEGSLLLRTSAQSGAWRFGPAVRS
jgi:hypothetical protein